MAQTLVVPVMITIDRVNVSTHGRRFFGKCRLDEQNNVPSSFTSVDYSSFDSKGVLIHIRTKKHRPHIRSRRSAVAQYSPWPVGSEEG